MKIHTAVMLAMLGASALPAAQAAEYEEFGRVTRVEPRVEQVRQPREECRTEYVQAPVQRAQPQRNAGGAILGAIVGGIVGNQVGGGSGRAAATAVGVMGGAVVGDKLGNQNRGEDYDAYPATQEQAVRRCRMVESYESRTVGYNVSYDFNGRSYTSIMDRDPGRRIRLRVSVEPEHMQ